MLNNAEFPRQLRAAGQRPPAGRVPPRGESERRSGATAAGAWESCAITLTDFDRLCATETPVIL